MFGWLFKGEVEEEEGGRGGGEKCFLEKSISHIQYSAAGYQLLHCQAVVGFFINRNY